MRVVPAVLLIPAPSLLRDSPVGAASSCSRPRVSGGRGEDIGRYNKPPTKVITPHPTPAPPTKVATAHPTTAPELISFQFHLAPGEKKTSLSFCSVHNNTHRLVPQTRLTWARDVNKSIHFLSWSQIFAADASKYVGTLCIN